MNKLITGAKRGVSDWKLFFNDKEILINSVYDEHMTYYPDGTVEILINDALVRTDLLDELKNKENIYKVEQESFMLDTETRENVKLIEIHNDMQIAKISMKVTNGECSLVNIVLTNRYYTTIKDGNGKIIGKY